MPKLSDLLPEAREPLDAALRVHPPASGSPACSDPIELRTRIQAAARALGFARIGFCAVDPFVAERAHLAGWLEAGRHGEMSYLARDDRADPRTLFADAKTLIVVALAYASPGAVALRRAEDGPVLRGSVARYARGKDYHDVMRDKLRRLGAAVASAAGRPVRVRACVDSAPLLERAAAERAGVGFVGKSTLSIAPGLGSTLLLAELLVDVEIARDEPIAPRCGSCRLCLDACPTGAFLGPNQLDARRCISYLTIELTGPIPRELREPIGTRVFGCDVCQDVCPFNASQAERPQAPELSPRPELAAPDLIALLELGSAAYRRLVRGSALRRTHRAQLARNAAVALGNSGDARAVAPLVRSLAAHSSALVRGHAAWALGQLGRPACALGMPALECAAAHDPDGFVREEAALARARLLALDDGGAPLRELSLRART